MSALIDERGVRIRDLVDLARTGGGEWIRLSGAIALRRVSAHLAWAIVVVVVAAWTSHALQIASNVLFAYASGFSGRVSWAMGRIATFLFWPPELGIEIAVLLWSVMCAGAVALACAWSTLGRRAPLIARLLCGMTMMAIPVWMGAPPLVLTAVAAAFVLTRSWFPRSVPRDHAGTPLAGEVVS